jgi:hypothetical protein
MKQIVTVACGLVFAGFLASQTPAPPPPFLTVTYLDVDGAKADQYNEFLRSTTSKVMQARIDAGEIRSWISYKVVLPGISTTPYTNVSVVSWVKHPILDPDPASIEPYYKKAGTTRAAYFDRVRTIGVKLVRREIWRMYENVGDPIAVGDFVRVDPKRVTGMQEYTQLERSIWKPMHEARIKHGALKGWGALWLTLPSGDDYAYNAATVEIYKDEAQMFTPPRLPDNPMKLAHGDKDLSADMKKMQEINKQLARTVLRAQYVLRAKPATAAASGQ